MLLAATVTIPLLTLKSTFLNPAFASSPSIPFQLATCIFGRSYFREGTPPERDSIMVVRWPTSEYRLRDFRLRDYRLRDFRLRDFRLLHSRLRLAALPSVWLH